MRSKGLAVLVVSFCLIIHTKATASDITVGIGIAHAYAGLGLNIGLRYEDTLPYVAAGCAELRSDVDEMDNRTYQVSCGLGIGLFSSGLVPTQSNKHTIGLHLSSHQLPFKEIDRETWITTEEGHRIEFMASASYTFFSRGVSSPGFMVSFSPTTYRQYRGFGIGPLFSGGYQF